MSGWRAVIKLDIEINDYVGKSHTALILLETWEMVAQIKAMNVKNIRNVGKT